MGPYRAFLSSSSFSTGCKTDDGFTVILIPRVEGVETKPIKTSYSPSAGTAYVTFDDVKVPVEYTLGPEGGGIFVILSSVSAFLASAAADVWER